MGDPRDVIELHASATTPLPAGTYVKPGFSPRLSFAVGVGDAGAWFAVQSFEGFFDIQRGVGTADVVAVQFARVTAVFGAPDRGAAAPVPVSRAAEAIRVLRTNGGLRVVEASPAVMAGREGLGVTVDHAGTEAFAPVLAVPPGPISILPGRRLWAGFFDFADGLFAIMVGGSIAGWADAVTMAQPVLASVTITG